MYLPIVFISILVPVALAKNGCVQYLCKDMLACTQSESDTPNRPQYAFFEGSKKYWGKDGGTFTSALKSNSEDSPAFRQKMCNVPGTAFTKSFKMDFAVWRSHNKGNFYVDSTDDPSANYPNAAVRVRG